MISARKRKRQIMDNMASRFNQSLGAQLMHSLRDVMRRHLGPY